MATDLKDILIQFKALPRAVKVLAAIAVFDLVLFLAVNFALSGTLDDQLAEVDQLRAKQLDLRAQIVAVNTQNGRLPQLRRAYDAALARGILAPKDRNKLSDSARDIAVRNHLTSFSGPISPEKFTPVTGSAYQTATVTVEFENGAMLDSDIANFWNDLFSQLPAHYQIVSATMKRSVPSITPQVLDGIRSGQVSSLIDTKLSFRWTSLLAPGTPPQ